MNIWYSVLHQRQIIIPKGLDFASAISFLINDQDQDQIRILKSILINYEGEYATLEMFDWAAIWFVSNNGPIFSEIMLKCNSHRRIGYANYYTLDHNFNVDYRTRIVKPHFDIDF